MNIVTTIVKQDGYKIRICYDESPSNPRTDFDNFGTLVLSHKRYSVTNELGLKFNDYNSWDDIHKTIIKEHGPCVILPVYMYDHSGLVLSTSSFEDRWDSGQLGFIFVSNKKIREEFSLKHVSKKALAKSREILVSEIKLYGYYLNGNVYEFDILDYKDDVVDSCGGFYGYDHEKSGLLEAACDTIAGYVKESSTEEPDAVQTELKFI
jgi:hypothetical protein